MGEGSGAEPLASAKRSVSLRVTILGILGALALGAAGGFFGDWATDIRRVIEQPLPQPSPSLAKDPDCVPEWDEASAGEEALDVMVSVTGKRCWSRSIALENADTFDVQVRYANYTGDVTDDVTLQSWLPEGVELVAGTTLIKNSTHPNGKRVSDDILDPGINIGNYDSGANAYLMFTAKVTDAYAKPCGLGFLGAFVQTWHPEVSDWKGAAVLTRTSC